MTVFPQVGPIASAGAGSRLKKSAIIHKKSSYAQAKVFLVIML